MSLSESVLARIATQVERRPQQVALLYLASPSSVAHHTTYADLWASVTAVAQRLRRKAGRGARVGVALSASSALPPLQLAIVLAGCALVPLPATDPPRRLALVLAVRTLGFFFCLLLSTFKRKKKKREKKYSLTYSITRSLTHSLTHSFTHSFTNSLW